MNTESKKDDPIKKREAILHEALKCSDLKSLDKEAFLDAWKAIAFLQPGLHADGYWEADSGWPKKLKPFAREAFRRYSIGEITGAELYPASEAMMGLDARRNMREDG